MTSEHDRLLAEGPRSAPEPATVPDPGAVEAAAPGLFGEGDPEPAEGGTSLADRAAPAPDGAAIAGQETGEPARASRDLLGPPDTGVPAQGFPPPPAGPARSRRRGRPVPPGLSLGRLALPLAFGSLVVVRALRSGSSGGTAFAVIWVVLLAATLFWRSRRRR